MFGTPMSHLDLHHSNIASIERFSIKCRKTKTKVITLANHRGYIQSSEPIKTRSNYMKLLKSAGKRVRVSQEWFWFYFWWDEKVARSNRVAHKTQNQLLFDTQMKTALPTHFPLLPRQPYLCKIKMQFLQVYSVFGSLSHLTVNVQQFLDDFLFTVWQFRVTFTL